MLSSEARSSLISTCGSAPSTTAPSASSGCQGTPTLRTRTRSSGAPRLVAISKPTGTPPRGNASTRGWSGRKCCSRSASCRPAALRLGNIAYSFVSRRSPTIYPFARIGAALGTTVEDVYTQNRRLWVRLRAGRTGGRPPKLTDDDSEAAKARGRRSLAQERRQQHHRRGPPRGHSVLEAQGWYLRRCRVRGKQAAGPSGYHIAVKGPSPEYP